MVPKRQLCLKILREVKWTLRLFWELQRISEKNVGTLGILFDPQQNFENFEAVSKISRVIKRKIKIF